MQLPIRSSTASSEPSPHPQQAKSSLPYRPTPTTHPEFATPADPPPLPSPQQHPNTNPNPSLTTPQPQPPNTVYIIRLLEGWRQTPSSPVLKVEILGVFLDVELANEYTRKWLQERLPSSCYRYGEHEVKKGDGGVQVDVLTEMVDGSLLVDVERHFVM
ncbi:MAG: hypothetical protein L6R42_006468 [Xanthoria sp. 1 TBL-2021]|nr:MAG: hypothetical protein L6R42_006468 [Xanthoria sp. 1 TBL-2021]